MGSIMAVNLLLGSVSKILRLVLNKRFRFAIVLLSRMTNYVTTPKLTESQMTKKKPEESSKKKLFCRILNK